MEQSVKWNPVKKFKVIVSTFHTLPTYFRFFKKMFLRKVSKPGFGNLISIYFKFQLITGFLDHCAMIALEYLQLKFTTQFFHEIIGINSKIY